MTVDALCHAVCSNAQVLGVTNCPGTPFCAITENMLYTWANKQGIPTQSSSVTLYTLLRLAQNLCPGLTPLQIEEDLEGKFSQINQHWQQKKRHFYQQKEITYRGAIYFLAAHRFVRQPFHWKNFIIHYAYIRLVSVSIIFYCQLHPASTHFTLQPKKQLLNRERQQN